MRAVAVIAVISMFGCMASSVDSMARNTHLIDQRFSDEYRDAAADCLDANENWSGYDECMARWDTAADSVRILIASALALDIANDRDQFHEAACRWYRALSMVDALSPVELPAAKAGLNSKWRHRCGK